MTTRTKAGPGGWYPPGPCPQPPTTTPTRHREDHVTTTPGATAARRDLLLLLLGQMEHGTIASLDRRLIRPLVEAEMATLDQLEAQAATPYRELKQRFDDLREETRRQGDVHERAAQRAAETTRRATELEAVLREVLATFRHETHPGFPARQSEHVETKRIGRWQAILNHGPTCPDGEPCPAHDEPADGTPADGGDAR